MTTDPALDALKARISDADLGPVSEETGLVIALADGLAHVRGLPGAELGEILLFPQDIRGFVINLEEDALQAAFLDSPTGVEAGSEVARSGMLLSVPVGEALLGRVVDPLGRPLDDLGPIAAQETSLTEQPAPAISERDFVSTPVVTGILAIDALFAIGRGQRELIIGERGTGKTSIAVDAILNQRSSDIVCVYVAIGQHTTAVRRVIEVVREKGAFGRVIFVVAPAAAEPGLRWLAPFAATSMAEWFRDRGGHSLIVYDDLTKHAAVHRELALLSRQPPGREAYPGDIFYLHARLLERSAKLSSERGGGSMTALPIAEIEAGNLAAYIPTNLISIADGQLVTSANLFAANQRPAIDIGLSVSRVGGKTQSQALKAVAGRVRLDYAQFLEMKMFSRFGGFGDAAMRKRMRHGESIAALLAQDRHAPLTILTQIALLTALANDRLRDLPLAHYHRFKDILQQQIESREQLASLDRNPQTISADEREALLACVDIAVQSVSRAIDQGTA
jgi:F-type H+-transporting ATPase subunit alpha